MLFRPRGNVTNDPKFATAARVMTIDDMLSFRDTWVEKLTPDFDVESIIREARAEKKIEPAKLTTTDAGYKKKSASEIDETERIVRNVQGVLNKLTEKNFDVLEKEVLVPEILNMDVIPLIVDRIFDKALDEAVFTPLYAKLCHNIAEFEAKTNAELHKEEIHKGGEIRWTILFKAQRLFEELTSLTSTSDEEATKMRRRSIANIRFVGELYNRRMLSLKVISQILKKLMFEETIAPGNAEVALELLVVSGKELENTDKKEPIWSQVNKVIARDPPPFPRRLCFLFQNLLDLRLAGWVRKEDPLAAVAAQDGQQMKSPSPPPEEMMPPPELRRLAQPLTASADSQMSEAEQKEAQRLGILAEPPSLFNAESAKLLVLNKVRECVEEGAKGDWDKLLKQDLSTAISPSDPEHVNRQGCLFVLLTILGKRTDVKRQMSNAQMIQAVLNKPQWDTTDLSRGLAWCVTRAIASRLTEDSPKFLERFADCLYAISASHRSLTFEIIVKDVFARTANYLDALQITWEYSSAWDVDYIKVWEQYVIKVRTGSAHSSAHWQPASKIESILDSLGSVRQTAFMRNIVPDFVGAMLANKFCTPEDLQQWCAKHENNAKMKQLVEELAMF